MFKQIMSLFLFFKKKGVEKTCDVKNPDISLLHMKAE